MKTLNLSLKWQLLSHSAKALKVCTIALDVSLISFKNIHEMAGRASPDKLMDYKLALQLLYKTFNSAIPVQDWINVNLLNINTSRRHFSINKSNKVPRDEKYKVNFHDQNKYIQQVNPLQQMHKLNCLKKS